MSGIIIRKALKEDAPQVAELFMPAWPVEQIIEANSTTYEQLLASIITIDAAPGPAYSYENTFVAATEAGEFYLDSAGVLQEYRGRGIVTVFLAMTIILSYRT